MKSSSLKSIVFEEPGLILSKREKGGLIPPWRKRLRRWLGGWLYELLREPRLVREVGPNSRPLERYEFESRSVYEKQRLL